MHHPSPLPSLSPFPLPSRRAVLAGTGRAALSSLLPGTIASALALEGALLRRAIPHGNGELLPVVGVGTAQVFDVADDAAKRRDVAAVLKVLFEGGGSVIDTASSYGTSEEVVGALTSAREGGGSRTNRAFLATKLEERTGAPAREEFMTSLKRLRVKQVDLLQLHNVKPGDSGLGFFFDLKKEGLTRYVGATTTYRDDYGAMEALIKRDKPDFIEIDCSIANREAEARIIPAAADAGTAVLIAVPLGRADLFTKVKGKPLPPIAKEIGADTWGQVFLKYLLGNPAITAVIPGTASPAHMADNLGAGHGPMPDARQRQALVTYFEQLG